MGCRVMKKVNIIDANDEYIFGKNLKNISFDGHKEIEFEEGKTAGGHFIKDGNVISYVTSNEISLIFDDGSGCVISLDPYWKFEYEYRNLGIETSFINKNNKILLTYKIEMEKTIIFSFSDGSIIKFKPKHTGSEFELIIIEK